MNDAVAVEAQVGSLVTLDRIFPLLGIFDIAEMAVGPLKQLQLLRRLPKTQYEEQQEVAEVAR